MNALLAGELDADNVRVAHDHVDQCASCRELFAMLGRAFADLSYTDDLSAVPPEFLLARGTRVDRFSIVERIGHGAMGQVYAAHDPELDRKVALKFSTLGVRSADAVRGEAKAIARLNHPNVLTVHDVGVHAGHLYIATELVEGETAARWVRRHADHGWRAIVDVYRQAAIGLAAAHARGLVHRDFKPDNVLVGEDGRVRVGDFGLALPIVAADAADSSSGALVGTPAYMAPEQLVAGAADPRSDQFSFCVALYEAVYGERPFDGTTLAEIRASVTSGAVRRAPSASRVPTWLRRVLVRGLSADPTQRWSSMLELERALSGRMRRRRRNLALAGAGVLAVGAAMIAYGEHQADTGARRASAAHLCTGATAQLAGIWDDGRRAELSAAYGTLNEAWTTDALARTTTALDRWRREWVAGHEDACKATRVRGEQSEADLDVRLACYARARDELASTTRALIRHDRRSLESAPLAVTALPSISSCARVETARDRHPPPQGPGVTAQVEEATRLRREATSARLAGDVDGAIRTLRTVIALADAIPYPSLAAEALLALGENLQERDWDEARDALAKAQVSADAIGRDDIRIRALTLLVYVETIRGRDVEARRWLELARGAFARAGSHSDRIDLAVSEAQLLAAEGRGEEALALLRPLSPYEDDPEGLDIGSTRAAVLVTLGRRDEAIVELERALRRDEARAGRDHPTAEGSAMRLMTALPYSQMHRAEPLARHLIEVNRPSPHLVTAWTMIADIASFRGDDAGALAALRTAERTAVQIDEDSLAMTRASLVRVLIQSEALDEAQAMLDALVARPEPAEELQLGAGELDILRADLLLARGDRRGARRILDRLPPLTRPGPVREEAAAALDAEHAASLLQLGEPARALELARAANTTFRHYAYELLETIEITVTEAEALLDLGRPRDALDVLEPVHSAIANTDLGARYRAYVDAVRGRARWELGIERVASRAAVKRALVTLGEPRPHDRYFVTTTRRWLARHR